MSTYAVTLIPGDGIGPEVTEATRRTLEATGTSFNWEVAEIGSVALDKHGTPLPEEVIESIEKNRVALKGPVTTPVGSGFRSVNVALRQKLGLYACLRPCKTYPGVPEAQSDVDLVIVRENLEDLYAGIEFDVGAGETKKLIELVMDATGQQIRDDIFGPDSQIME